MSMSSQQKRFTEEFKIEAVRQVTKRGHRVADVAERLGVSTHSLYQWRKRYGTVDGTELRRDADQGAEVRRLKAELRWVTEERDILKKAAVYFAKQSRLSTPLFGIMPRTIPFVDCVRYCRCIIVAIMRGDTILRAAVPSKTVGSWR